MTTYELTQLWGHITNYVAACVAEGADACNISRKDIVENAEMRDTMRARLHDYITFLDKQS